MQRKSMLKKNITFQLLAFFILSQVMSFNVFCNEATEDEIEVPLSNLFIPSEGFDSNDQIEFVADFNIPNLCYQYSRYSINQHADNASPRTYEIKIFLKKRTILECLDDLLVPKAYNVQIPYFKVISLGELQIGDYKLVASQFSHPLDNRLIISKSFKISMANKTSVDDYQYAPISSAFIPEIISETNYGNVILTGQYPSSCMLFDQNKIDVKIIGHTIIVSPYISIIPERDCSNSLSSLQVVVPIGKLVKGRYHLHVRSMSGMSLNRLFTVVPEKETNGHL